MDATAGRPPQKASESFMTDLAQKHLNESSDIHAMNGWHASCMAQMDDGGEVVGG